MEIGFFIMFPDLSMCLHAMELIDDGLILWCEGQISFFASWRGKCDKWGLSLRPEHKRLYHACDDKIFWHFSQGRPSSFSSQGMSQLKHLNTDLETWL